VNFLILCFSGIILIWKDELEGKKSNTHQINERWNSQSYALTAQEISHKYSNNKILSIFKDESNLIQVRLGNKSQVKFKGAQKKVFDLYGKELELFNTKDSTWLDWTLRLHRQLLMGGSGKYLIALIGLFIVFVIISGILIIPSFKGIKDRHGVRFTVSRLHQKIGTLTFSWLVLITFTGIFLALNSLLIGLFLQNALNGHRILNPIMNDSNQLIGIGSVIEKVERVLPEYEIDFIAFPNTEFSLPNSYALLLEKSKDKKIAFVKNLSSLDLVVVDLPWYLKLLVVSEPLHFGNYGGKALKLLWSIFGFLSGVIPLTGYINYFFRRIKKNNRFNQFKEKLSIVLQRRRLI